MRRSRKTEEIVAAIYENYQFVSQLITSLDAASKRLSWQEMEKHLKGTQSERCKKDRCIPPGRSIR